MTEQSPIFTSHFDGETYEPSRDKARLTGQLKAVYNVMSDGEWRSLIQISQLAGIKLNKYVPDSSASARLRDLRKDKFGGYEIERKSMGNGIFHYRMVV